MSQKRCLMQDSKFANVGSHIDEVFLFVEHLPYIGPTAGLRLIDELVRSCDNRRRHLRRWCDFKRGAFSKELLWCLKSSSGGGGGGGWESGVKFSRARSQVGGRVVVPFLLRDFFWQLSPFSSQTGVQFEVVQQLLQDIKLPIVGCMMDEAEVPDLRSGVGKLGIGLQDIVQGRPFASLGKIDSCMSFLCQRLRQGRCWLRDDQRTLCCC
mmetsp:Transcript_81427/g.170277  ORF Transcript_81427/g.170277 Transcript_81427/m.170277 type:complete len:210 (-) Transcript_81427:483-1112(-)